MKASHTIQVTTEEPIGILAVFIVATGQTFATLPIKSQRGVSALGWFAKNESAAAAIAFFEFLQSYKNTCFDCDHLGLRLLDALQAPTVADLRVRLEDVGFDYTNDPRYNSFIEKFRALDAIPSLASYAHTLLKETHLQDIESLHDIAIALTDAKCNDAEIAFKDMSQFKKPPSNVAKQASDTTHLRMPKPPYDLSLN